MNNSGSANIIKYRLSGVDLTFLNKKGCDEKSFYKDLDAKNCGFNYMWKKSVIEISGPLLYC